MIKPFNKLFFSHLTMRKEELEKRLQLLKLWKMSYAILEENKTMRSKVN
jgi:hypothetical protein